MAKEKSKPELPVVLEGELQTRLVQLREDAGLSTSQLADAMCLSEEVILHLENEDFDQLAEPPYVRGYLRNYAKLGDTDPKELISRYEALRGAGAGELDYQIKTSANISISKHKSMSPVWAQLILLALLIGGISLLTMIPGVNQWFKTTWSSLSTQLQSPNGESGNNPLLTGSLPVPVPLPGTDSAAMNNTANLPLDIDNTQSNNKPTDQENTENANSSDTQAESTTDTQAENTTETAANIEASDNTQQAANTETSNTTNAEPATAETPVTGSSDQIKIKLVFNKDVWLRIRNKDNKTVFEGLNKLGTDKDLTIEKPLTFRVGNAQGLSLFVDDKAVDISQYINGSIANFTLE